MKRSGFTVMRKLITLVRPLTGFMILAIVMGLLGNLCAATITIFGGYAVLDVLQFSSPISCTAAFVCMAIFALCRAALRYGEQSCNHFIAFKLLALIRDKVFAALRRLCPAKLEGRDKGDLISLITSDIELLEVFYAHTVSPVVIWVLFTLFFTLFIGSFHPLLGVIALLFYLIIGVVLPLVTSKLGNDAGLRLRNAAGELSSFVLESLRGLPETLRYGQGERRRSQMHSKTRQCLSCEGEMSNRTGRTTAVLNTLILVADFTMLIVSALLCRNGSIGFEGLLISNLAMYSSFGPSIALANLGSTLQTTFAAGNRVLDILEESPLVEEISGNPEISFTGAEVENVSFSYGEERVLNNVSLQIPANTVVGIAGKSGSGKSTLLRLLMRFWETDSGNITISGTEINRVNTENLRNIESFVPQDTHLFHDSIKNNIRIAKLDATDEEIEAACKKASVDDFIKTLPQGYDTPVGELGDTLSGGERQRLGLARAFLHDAPLMLLDEPTGNLDSLNEAVILKSLDNERADKTVVLVSHRKSTMQIADTTYSVESGRVS